MIEDLEYSISQYLDGTLPALEQSELELCLKDDATARALLDEYKQLEQAIRATAGAVPAMKWDALSGAISAVVATAKAPASAAGQNQSSQAFWANRRFWTAMAASVAIVLGISFEMFRNKAGHPNIAVAPTPTETRTAIVVGPAPEAPVGSARAEVTLGEPPRTAEAARDYPYAEGVVVQPSRVTIASARMPRIH